MKLLTDEETSKRMKRIKSSGTQLEKKLARLIHRAGLHYRSQPQLYGNPDFRIVGTIIVVFCDSSFWHGRRKKELTGKAFRRNRFFWIKKLKFNKKRSAVVNKHLRKLGWIVIRFWDDEINKNPDIVIRKLKQVVRHAKYE